MRKKSHTRQVTWPDIVRALGIAIILWQLLLDEIDRPYMLAIAGWCIGMKEIVNWQNRKNGE